MAGIGVAASVPQSSNNDESSNIAHNSGRFSYMWKVDGGDFRRQSHRGGSVTSPNFSVGIDDDDYTFSMMLIPSIVNNGFTSLHLDLVASKNRTVKLQVVFSILDIQNKKFQTIGKRNEVHQIVRGESVSFEKCINKQRLLNNINRFANNIDCHFTILCEGEIVSPAVRVSTPIPQNNAEVFDVPACEALKNLGLLIDSQKFSDVTLATVDREFRAHKAILTAQSPVFAAMFEHEMAEHNENLVNIEDIDGDVLEVMLRYIYTGEANLDRMASKLLMAADKYELTRLKVMCGKELASTITIDNAIDILIIADLYSAHKLKAKSMDFVIQRPQDFTESPKLKTLFTSHPLLAAEMFRVLATKRKL